MKTKVLKFVMPVFAFILAIGLAFATENEDNSQMGYYFDLDTGQIESVPVDCDSSTIIRCEFNGYPLFSDPGLNEELNKSSH